MTNEKKSSDRTARIVFAALAANAATAFTIQAWMTYGFGAEVWGLPFGLCLALIFALDVFAVTFMVLTYLLRGTGWPRAFVTVVFLFAIAAQVYAAELYGAHRSWTTEIRWFASLPAVLLALSQEGVIVWRTHRADPAPPAPTTARRVEGVAAAAIKRMETTAAEQAAGDAPARERPPRPPAPPAPKPAPDTRPAGARGRTIDPAEQAKRDATADRVIRLGADKKAKEAAADLHHVSVRTIENWVASYRERRTPETGNTQVTAADRPAETTVPNLITEVKL